MIKLDIQKFAATYDPSSLTIILSKDESITSFVTVNFDSEDDTIINHYTTPIINPGYSIINWNTEPDGSGHTYTWSSTPDDFYSQGDAEPNVTTTVFLFAQWQPNSYEITFDGNDATTQGTISTSITYGTNVLSPITNPQKSGCTFEGWYTQRNGGTLVINTSGVLQSNVPDITDSNGNWISSQDEVFYARWTIDFTSQTVLTDQDNFNDIADAIREQNGTQTTYKPEDMAAAIRNISSDIDIINATIEEYKSSTDQIDAHSFVNFMNSHKLKSKWIGDKVLDDDILKFSAAQMTASKIAVAYTTLGDNNKYVLKVVIVNIPWLILGDPKITVGEPTIICSDVSGDYNVEVIKLRANVGIAACMVPFNQFGLSKIVLKSFSFTVNSNDQIIYQHEAFHGYTDISMLPNSYRFALSQNNTNSYTVMKAEIYVEDSVVSYLIHDLVKVEEDYRLTIYDFVRWSGKDNDFLKIFSTGINSTDLISQLIDSSYGAGQAYIFNAKNANSSSNIQANSISLSFYLSKLTDMSSSGFSVKPVTIYSNATTRVDESEPSICRIAYNKVLITYAGDNNKSLYGVIATLKTSKEYITLGTPFLIDAEAGVGWYSKSIYLAMNKVLITYGGDETHTKAIVLYYNSSNDSMTNSSTYYLSNHDFYEDATYKISGEANIAQNCVPALVFSLSVEIQASDGTNNIALFYLKDNKLLVDSVVNMVSFDSSKPYLGTDLFSVGSSRFVSTEVLGYEMDTNHIYSYKACLLGKPYQVSESTASQWIMLLAIDEYNNKHKAIPVSINQYGIGATGGIQDLGYGKWADIVYDENHWTNATEFFVASVDSSDNLGKICLTRYTIDTTTGSANRGTITKQNSVYITDSELGALNTWNLHSIKVNALKFPGENGLYSGDTFFLITYCYKDSNSKYVIKGWLARKGYSDNTLTKYCDPKVLLSASRNLNFLDEMHVITTDSKASCVVLLYVPSGNDIGYKAFVVSLNLDSSQSSIPTSMPFEQTNFYFKSIADTEKDVNSVASAVECEGQIFVTYMRAVNYSRTQLYGFLIGVKDDEILYYSHMPLSKESPDLDLSSMCFLNNIYLGDGRVMALYPSTDSSGDYDENSKVQKTNILKGTVYNISDGTIKKEYDTILSRENLSGRMPCCLLYDKGTIYTPSYYRKKYALLYTHTPYVYPDNPGMPYYEWIMGKTMTDDKVEILKPIVNQEQKYGSGHDFGDSCFYNIDGLTEENITPEISGEIEAFETISDGNSFDLNSVLYNRTAGISLYDYNLDITLPTDYNLYLYKPNSRTDKVFPSSIYPETSSSGEMNVSNLLYAIYLFLCTTSSMRVLEIALIGNGVYNPADTYYDLYIDDGEDNISLIDVEKFDLGNLRMITYPCGLCSSLDGSLDSSKCSWEASAYQAGSPVGEVTLTIDFIKDLTNQELLAQNYYFCFFNVDETLDKKFIIVPLSKYISSFDSTNGRITIDIPYLGFFMILKKYDDEEEI